MYVNPYILWIGLLVSASCTNYLDTVPDRSRAVLSTLEQYEYLLNYSELYMAAPSIGDIGADYYELPKAVWSSASLKIRQAYTWQPDTYLGNTSAAVTQDWNACYNSIYYANVVLEGIDRLETDREALAYRNVKSHALFLRAFHHYLLQELYGQPYRPSGMEADLGIPLKLTASLDAPISRSTVAGTFRQIVKDLDEALALSITDYQASNKLWSSRATICALLSRVYLTMQRYDQSMRYADECLGYYDVLLDLNGLAPGYQFPYPDNPEMLIVFRQAGWGALLGSASTQVNGALYGSYTEYDLRKQVYFRAGTGGAFSFKNLYSGSSNPFSGLAIDEVYLNRAECRARSGDLQGALDDLNHLLAHKYLTGHFEPYTLVDTADPLATILQERHKELVIRGTRWADLRRLNQDVRFAIALQRGWDDEIHTLPPNDDRYTYLLPNIEIALNGLPQNQR